MKRLIFALLLLPQLAFSQYQDGIFSLDIIDCVIQMQAKESFVRDTTIIFSEKSKIKGLSVSGTSYLYNDDDSYVRITLVDEYDYEFLVYENFPTLTDELSTDFDNSAIETISMDNIAPKCLKITLKNASLKLSSINISKASTAKGQQRSQEIIHKEQAKYIVDKLNANLEKRNMTWRAGLTSIALKSFAEKKDMFGGKVPQLHGFEYYAGGIFVLPGGLAPSESPTAKTVSSQYVTEWDWRNRHGKNWVTSVKDQHTCGSCWAFSAVSVLESYIKLYYNQSAIDYNLSEQELVSCDMSNDGCSGGTAYDAFLYIMNHGIVKEDCFPYYNIEVPCSLKCSSPQERVFVEGRAATATNEDSIKKHLLNSPMSFGILPWSHIMNLIGYHKLKHGDTFYLSSANPGSSFTIISNQHVAFIGRTAWLVKNSWGTDWGTDGYGYIIASINDLNVPHYLKGRITCNGFTDSDIVCEDKDGDGYYFWGIGPKPANCPYWVPDEPDGDDSVISLGPMDAYGNLEQLTCGETISIPFSYTGYHTLSCRLGIVDGGVLTISGTTVMSSDTNIRVCENGTLIIDGGTLQNANLTLVPGCTVILRNGGIINMASGSTFNAPVGAVVKIESGEIH